MIDEKELIAGIKSGSEHSYKICYEQWVSRLHRFVFHYVKSETVADDIVQETFIRIWENRKNLDVNCSFKSYLFTISYRLLLKELRRQLNNPIMAEFMNYQTEFVTNENETGKRMEFDAFMVALKKAKQQLSSRQKEIFEMNKEQDISISDIAKSLNIKKQVVRNQLSASLKIIRSELLRYMYLSWLLLFRF